jgi:lipid-A-disaccharide synthase
MNQRKKGSKMADVPGRKIFIAAGEASGDLHGGALARSLVSLDPDIELFGIGGKSMESAGVTLGYHVQDLGVTGFTEVVGKLNKIIKALRWAVSICREKQPDAAVLIDYPDFNLRLAKRLHKLGIKVVYFVSPQLWAWRSGRVKLIEKYIERMLVLFPFEEEWYRTRGVMARYVGNPVVDHMQNLPDRSHCRSALNIPENSFLIALLPGSRRNEVQRILPVFIRAAGILQRDSSVEFVLPVASSLTREYIDTILSPEIGHVTISELPASQVLQAADFAWVTSGTATLETALTRTPMVIVYKTSTVSYLLARMLVKIPYIGMVNLVAESEVAPELIQGDVTPENILAETRAVLQNPDLLTSKQEKLNAVADRMGMSGASDRAAAEIMAVCRTAY